MALIILSTTTRGEARKSDYNDNLYKGQKITVIIPCLNQEQGASNRSFAAYLTTSMTLSSSTTPPRTGPRRWPVPLARRSSARRSADRPQLQEGILTGHWRHHRDARRRSQLSAGRDLVPAGGIPAPRRGLPRTPPAFPVRDLRADEASSTRWGTWSSRWRRRFSFSDG